MARIALISQRNNGFTVLVQLSEDNPSAAHELMTVELGAWTLQLWERIKFGRWMRPATSSGTWSRCCWLMVARQLCKAEIKNNDYDHGGKSEVIVRFEYNASRLSLHSHLLQNNVQCDPAAGGAETYTVSVGEDVTVHKIYVLDYFMDRYQHDTIAVHLAALQDPLVDQTRTFACHANSDVSGVWRERGYGRRHQREAEATGLSVCLGISGPMRRRAVNHAGEGPIKIVLETTQF